MENYTYQRMRKFVENELNRRLTEGEYKRFKLEMDNYIITKFINKEWRIYNGEA